VMIAKEEEIEGRDAARGAGRVAAAGGMGEGMIRQPIPEAFATGWFIGMEGAASMFPNRWGRLGISSQFLRAASAGAQHQNGYRQQSSAFAHPPALHA
jgi:hypothetical protein